MSNKKHMPDWPCPGIAIEPGRYSGCSGGRDCPVCRGDFALATGARNMIDYSDFGSIGIMGISEGNWQDFLSSKPENKKDDDARRACSCGCRACEGSGWYRFGRSYKKCCTPCPVHYPDNE